MKPGDRVEKVKGYKWPGVILASFLTTKGERRLVVECTVPEVAGALHIYAPEQLRVLDEQTITTTYSDRAGNLRRCGDGGADDPSV